MKSIQKRLSDIETQMMEPDRVRVFVVVQEAPDLFAVSEVGEPGVERMSGRELELATFPGPTLRVLISGRAPADESE